MNSIIPRRQFLLGGLMLAGTGVLAACVDGSNVANNAAAPSPRPTTFGEPTVTKRLTAKPISLDFGGIEAKTWGYVAETGSPTIEATAGDVLRVNIANELPESTSIHWHGIALHDAADGVPGMTQEPIKAGEDYTYTFQVPHGGTYFYHSHSGLQLDRGLHAPLIIRDPEDTDDHDVEWVIVLDDWLDGLPGTPEEELEKLTGMGGDTMGGMSHGSMMGGMHMGSGDPALGGDAGDVLYPHYLINERIPSAHRTFEAKPGNKARLRFINAGGDTIFKVALGGHRMTVTHTDGFPVQPQETESFYISMGERVDVEVTLGDGVFPLVALAAGKDDRAFAVIRTSAGEAPRPDVEFPELSSKALFLSALKPAERALLAGGKPDKEVSIDLGGQMMPYKWTLLANGSTSPATVQEGQRLRMFIRNRSMMAHPIHLHGHTWSLASSNGLRKDTVLLLPHETVIADIIADNPGEWSLHCHNAYHMEVGMISSLKYT